MTLSNLNSAVVVGGGLASAKAVETFRTEGYDGKLFLISQEPYLPYDRPPLTKGFFTDATEPNLEVFNSSFYENNDIELILDTRCEKLNPASSTVELSNSQTLNYDVLILATGARARELNLSNSKLSGIYYLRTIEDARAIKDASLTSGEVVIIGAGWIGCELAASLSALGVKITVIDPLPYPLHRVLGESLGKHYLDLHTQHRVKYYLNTGVKEINGINKVESVTLSNCETLKAPVVIVGIGAVPNVDFLMGNDLFNPSGIQADANLRTKYENVFAAGDVTNCFNTILNKHIRLEHWAGALSQGPIAAKNALGRMTNNDTVPFFYSDQYGLSIEFRGQNDDYDDVVIRGDIENNEFIYFWLKDSQIVGVLNANIWDYGDLFDQLIRIPILTDPLKLADSDFDLNELGKDHQLP